MVQYKFQPSRIMDIVRKPKPKEIELMNIRDFGHNSFVTWTATQLREERMEDYDYECQTCNHRITVPFDQFTPPTVCEECGDSFCFLSKEIIEENMKINAEET